MLKGYIYYLHKKTIIKALPLKVRIKLKTELTSCHWSLSVKQKTRGFLTHSGRKIKRPNGFTLFLVEFMDLVFG